MMIGRQVHQKVTVGRGQVLESARTIMGDSSLRNHGLLDIEYKDEEGMGVGPTLEFYALVSKEIREMPIWRNTGEETGLFPRPYKEIPTDVLASFEFVGQLVGKAISDERILDLHISHAFWKLVFGHKVDEHDLEIVDPVLYKAMQHLKTISAKSSPETIENL